MMAFSGISICQCYMLMSLLLRVSWALIFAYNLQFFNPQWYVQCGLCRHKIAVTRCLFVRLSVCHTPVFYRHGWKNITKLYSPSTTYTFLLFCAPNIV